MNRPGLPSAEFSDDAPRWSRSIAGRIERAGSLPSALPLSFALRAPFPKTLRIALDPASLAGANAISLDLANRSPAGCLAGIRLSGFGAQAAAAGGCHFSGALEPLAAGVRRRVHYPFHALGREGAAGAWAGATVLEIVLALPKDSRFDGQLAIELHGVDGLSLVFPPGPRLSAAGLRRVASRRHLRAGPDGAGFDFEWSQKGQPFLLMANPPLPAPLEPPDLLLQGRMMGRAVGFPPDWAGAGRASHQWLHFLHRHHFLRPLARQYAQAPDNRLVEAAARAITDWIAGHPVPLDSGGGAGPAWETLSAAWRLREWLGIMSVMWPSPAFRGQARSLMLRSAWEHARHLADHQGHPTNWALVEAASLALAGLRLDCFRQARTWVQTGMRRLTHAARRQFFPDGAHLELSPLYQAVCLEALLAVGRALADRGRALPAVLAGVVRRGLAYLAALRRPDGTWTAHNDAWGIDGDHGAVFALAAEVMGKDGGSPGRPRGPARRFFPQAGVCRLGGGDARGNRLVLRAGPAGAAHAHDDSLSLDVCLAGRPFVVDPGVSGYDPGPLAGHYRSPAAHSLPWVEGWARAAAAMTWAERIGQAHGDLVQAARGGLEAATAVAWGPWARPEQACLVLRSVVNCRGDYFVVRDHFAGQGARRLGVRWQFAPGALELGPGGRRACLGGPGGAVGWLACLGMAQDVEIGRLEGGLDPPGGWVAVAGRDVPAPCLVYGLTAPLPQTLVWLLWPGSAPPDAALSAGADQSGAVSLRVNLPGGGWDELALGPPGLAAPAPGRLAQGGVRLKRHAAGGGAAVLSPIGPPPRRRSSA